MYVMDQVLLMILHTFITLIIATTVIGSNLFIQETAIITHAFNIAFQMWSLIELEILPA